MASLIPFDFRCVGHLTGVSLRCAPQHLCLARQQHIPALHLTTSSEGADEGGSCQSLCMRSNKQEFTAAVLRHPSPPPHATSADDSGRSSSRWSSAPENKTLLNVEAAHPATEAVVGMGAPVCTASFHNPSLSIEVYFTIGIPPPFSSSALGVGPLSTAASARLKYGAEPSKRHDYRGGGDGEWVVEGQRPPTLAASPAIVYTSEVASGSPHPCWSAIPSGQLKAYSAATEFELAFYYTAACLSKAVLSIASASGTRLSAAKSFDDIVQMDVCVHCCHVDMRDVLYAGSTMEEADAVLARVFELEEQQPQSRCSTSPIIFLRYTDGVFVPRVCLSDFSAAAGTLLKNMQAARTCTFAPPPTGFDFQVTPPFPTARHMGAGHTSIAVSDSAAAAACEELAWSRTPSSVGWRYPPTAVPRAGPLGTTMGDVKAAALTTVAWQRLADVIEARQAKLAAGLNREVASNPLERAQEVRCAALRVQVSAAREQLTISTLELEALQERVERRQRQLETQEEALAKLQLYQAQTASPEVKEQSLVAARQDEVQRARLRAQLARSRQQRTRELCLLYRVELSSQYANQACTRAADAKDHINKCTLPIIFAGRADADAASHLVASTAEDMHAEAVALGHAGHLLVVLSILYSCSLPYPIVLGSGQSFILPSPHLCPPQVSAAPFTLAEARKYPLSCHKVAERPLMMAGVRLLVRDGIVLAKAMGKPERQVLACSDRLGALLDLLLRDVE